jgi:tetratricopeptide (TPR) repeat protein
MGEKGAIKIRSGLHKEYSTTVVIDGNKYLILTEDIEPEKKIITTTVYHKGKILSAKSLDCRHILDKPDFQKRIAELLYRQHETIASTLRQEKVAAVKTPSNFLNEVKTLLQRKNKRSALELLTKALKRYPDEPFLLSYYGCLEAVINKNYSYGIDVCLRSIETIDEKLPIGKEFFYPAFYLNLGRAYLAAGDKKNALEAFQKGLSFDRENTDLIWETKKLGARRKAVVPYLKRSHPINKYIGMLLHKMTKVPLPK